MTDQEQASAEAIKQAISVIDTLRDSLLEVQRALEGK